MALGVEKAQNSFVTSDNSPRYNLAQQLSILVVVCTLASCSFLPYLLQLDLYDADPDTPYSGAADDLLIDITNAVVVACMSMMLLEALLDSNSHYLPIKIAFPRFLNMFGVLFISVVLYGQQTDGMNRLSFLVCSHYAKVYFIGAGVSLKMLREAAERGSKQWSLHMLGVILITTDMLGRQWGAYVNKSGTFVIAQNCVVVGTVILAVYFLTRVVQLVLCQDDDLRNIGHRNYDIMSHAIIFILIFGINSVNVAFGFQTWKETSAAEIAGYSFMCLFVSVLFFFMSSYIAQRHFVMAKVCFMLINLDKTMYIAHDLCLHAPLYISHQSQLRNKKSFVRYVSHEIRTPLNTGTAEAFFIPASHDYYLLC